VSDEVAPTFATKISPPPVLDPDPVSVVDPNTAVVAVPEVKNVPVTYAFPLPSVPRPDGISPAGLGLLVLSPDTGVPKELNVPIKVCPLDPKGVKEEDPITTVPPLLEPDIRMFPDGSTDMPVPVSVAVPPMALTHCSVPAEL